MTPARIAVFGTSHGIGTTTAAIRIALACVHHGYDVALSTPVDGFDFVAHAIDLPIRSTRTRPAYVEPIIDPTFDTWSGTLHVRHDSDPYGMPDDEDIDIVITDHGAVAYDGWRTYAPPSHMPDDAYKIGVTTNRPMDAERVTHWDMPDIDALIRFDVCDAPQRTRHFFREPMILDLTPEREVADACATGTLLLSDALTGTRYADTCITIAAVARRTLGV